MKKEEKKSKNLSGRSLNENELNIVSGGISKEDAEKRDAKIKIQMLEKKYEI